MSDTERLLEDLRWLDGRRTHSPMVDFNLKNPAGKRLADLLAEQSDETLAMIWQKGVCRPILFEELLVIRYGVQLIQWVRSFGAGATDAQDLVQDVYWKMLNGVLDYFDPTRNFAAFLYTIAKHLYLDSVRRRRPIPVDNLERPGPDLTLLAVENQELERHLDEALKCLDEPNRKIMRLSIEGKAPHEIATILAMPAREVSRRLCQARKRLLELLHVELAPSTRGRPRNRPAACPGGYDLRLTTSLIDVSADSVDARRLVVVASVEEVLHFRILVDEKVVVDTDEKRLTGQTERIEALRTDLQPLWPPHELTADEKHLVITAVTTIASYTHPDQYPNP